MNMILLVIEDDDGDRWNIAAVTGPARPVNKHMHNDMEVADLNDRHGPIRVVEVKAVVDLPDGLWGMKTP